MSDEKDVLEMVENAKAPPRRRCPKFWWLYALLVVVVLVAILVPILIFVIIPQVVQSKIDSTQLTVNSISLTNTEPDSFRLGINTTLAITGSLVQATVDGFNGSLYLQGQSSQTPFVTVPFPPTSADVAQQDLVVSLDMEIADLASFSTFCAWVVSNKTLSVTVVGNTFVHLSGISHPYPVTFNKTITVYGLNSFEGLNVTSATISVPLDPKADNFHGYISIPNASNMTLDIGNASFSGLVNGVDVGAVFLDNLLLVPGPNNVSMRAHIDQVPVFTVITQKPYCSTGILPFTMVGTNVTKPAGELTYFSSALRQSSENVNIDVGAALKQDLNYTVTCH